VEGVGGAAWGGRPWCCLTWLPSKICRQGKSLAGKMEFHGNWALWLAHERILFVRRGALLVQVGGGDRRNGLRLR
jgi:hypothetical protein